MNRRSGKLGLASVGTTLVLAGLTSGVSAQTMRDVEAVAKERGLSSADLIAAAKTYLPSGQHDEYLMFASGGHAGQIFVVGLPSMRLLRSIAVFTPESWQGWGFGVGDEIIAEGYPINDPKHQLTGFWAQSCTTKGLQRAKRTPRPYE